MQRYQRTTILFLLFICASPIWAASPLEGDWIGGFERPESRVFVEAHFQATNNQTSGTMGVVDLSINTRFKGRPPDVITNFGYVPNTFVTGKPLDKLEFTVPRVHFELSDEGSPLSFDGRVTNDAITGVVQDRGMKLPFHLNLTTRIDPSRYVGNYQVGPGHFVRILPPSLNPVLLISLDTLSGQIRVLLPRSESDFVSGPEYDTYYPADVAIHFISNQTGQVTGLQWKPTNGLPLIGKRIDALQEQELSFTNGNVSLSGTLVLPPTKGPHPAVVITCGSGSWTRTGARFDADFFALNGVAALVYDKRGCGKSTGDWGKSGFDDLAGDMLAGVEALKQLPEINPHQIGLWGISQGGWIISLAASRSADVAFIISVSGPGITPEAQGAYCVEHWMEAAGYSKADCNEARSLFLLAGRCQRTDSGWDEVEARRKADQNKEWYAGCPYLNNDAHGADKFWQLIGDYDPVPALRKVHCPVLAIFGGSDPLVDARESVGIWKRELAKGGNRDVVVKIFPHANHGISDTRTWTIQPGSLAIQRDWVLKHVTVDAGAF
jgi:pimeloyl-ACP methyl ester carboxylesterase